MELELQDVREEVARVRHAARHVVLGAGIEGVGRPLVGRGHALVLLAQLPPQVVVAVGADFAGEHLPAPLVDQQAERQEGDFLQRLPHQQAEVSGRVRRLLEQADLLQVRRRDGQRQRVAHGLVETVVGAVAIQVAVVLVGPVVVVVAEFMVNGLEVLGVHVDAHLDAQVVLLVDVPGRGVTDHVAVGRLDEQRALPECLRQLGEAQRAEKGLAGLHHADRVKATLLQNRGQVVARARVRRRDQIVDIVPALRPHVAQQVGRNRAVLRHDIVAVGFPQPGAHVAVQRLVQRADLFPEAVQFAGKLRRVHVVA